MIASACLAAQLPSSAFGITDPTDVALVGEEILELLREQSRKAEMERMTAKLNG